jgi:MoaA/NifB/PqqE/SkfB family radical SAM enzyme
MTTHNGEQLYGLKRLWTTLKMGMNRELAGLSLKQKRALNYVSRESKLTRLGNRIFTNTFTPYYPSPAYNRFLRGVVSAGSGKPWPVVTNFAVTPHCPCDCWHCSFSDRSKRDVMTLEQLKDAITQVQEMGSSVIGFTGGEPLLRMDLEEIVAAVDERSMPILFTTGHGLTRGRIRRLKEAGLVIPVLSLDHYTAEKHDAGRRLKGIFRQTVEAIRMFREEGFYVAVSFVPDKKLVDDRKELFRVLEFFRDLGVNDMRLTSPILSGHLTARPEEKLTPENVETIFEVQRFCSRIPGYPGVFAYDYFESALFYGCCAGYNYMFIDSQGNLCPCDFTMMSFGNIMKRPIREIWQETSDHFRFPGRSCYANRSNDIIAMKKPRFWPMGRDAALEVLEACPPYDRDNPPEFWKRMGLK